jgi:hypothetical protein
MIKNWNSYNDDNNNMILKYDIILINEINSINNNNNVIKIQTEE